MSWPVDAVFEVLTATVTTVKAATVTAIQNAIVGLYGGTKSVVALVADGTGNQAVTPTAGALAATASMSGTSTPTTATKLGEYYKDFAPIGKASFSIGGGPSISLVRGVGIKSVSRTSAGVYVVTFDVAPAHPTTAEAMITPTDTGGDAIWPYYIASAEAITNNLVITVKLLHVTQDGTSKLITIGAADCGFGITAWCS